MTFLSKIWPGVGNVFGNVNHGFKEFALSNPFTPWWTAILVFIVGGIARVLIEDMFFYEFDIKEVPILALPALLWIWVFYGTMPAIGMVIFTFGYIVSLIGMPILLALISVLFERA